MSKFQGKKILIVDDEDMICQFLNEEFSEQGATVSVAADGVDAMVLLKSMPFDLVITDYRMPNANGIEVAKAASKTSPAVKVVICTGFSDEVNKEEMAAYKVATLIQKPFSVDEFLAQISQLL